MSLRRVVAGLVGATLLVPLSGPGRAQAPPPCTWEIGMMGALTGDAAHYARPMANGVRLAVELANRERDLPCALAVHAEDTQGDPTQAPRKAQELAGDEQVVACICGFFSGETLASGAIFGEAGLLMASTGTYRRMDQQGFGTWFRAIAADPVQGAATARYIVDRLGAESVSIVHDNQDYSKAIAGDVAAGVGDRANGPYIINPEERNYGAVVSHIKRVRPDVVFYGGYASEAAPFMRQLRQAGVRSVFVTDDGAKHGPFERSLGRFRGRARTKAACPCSDPTEIAGASAFVSEYKTSFGQRPRTYAADAFDVTNIAIDALRELSGTETFEQARAHVVSYFDAAEGVEGTVKDYTWNDRGDLVADEDDIFIWKWLDRARRWEYVGRVSKLTD